MKAFLRLSRLKIENANAIAGLTYGFPAVTSFLGFTHALSRQLQKREPHLKLGGCAIISHEQQIHTYQSSSWKDAVFCLSRNPLTKEGDPAPFIEEGKMHLTVSLLIECHFYEEDFYDNFENREKFESQVKTLALQQRLAGGLITEIGEVDFIELPEDFEKKSKIIRQQMRKLLPGFLLVERSDWLKKHVKNAKVNLLDAWLDFIALKQAAKKPESEGLNTAESIDNKIPSPLDAEWERIQKPEIGWLVPITTGYRAISALYPSGQVINVRDQHVPFQFVESVYTVGEWLSPHRIKENLPQIFWQYDSVDKESGWYLCKNKYST